MHCTVASIFGSCALFAALALPAPAGAAVIDRVVAEASPAYDLAVYGGTLAWSREGANGTVSVLLDPPGNAPPRRFDGGREGGAVSLGKDARGRLVLVYTRCTAVGKCVLRRVGVSSGRPATLSGISGSIYAPTLRRGVLVWLAGGRVRVRALAGGPIRTQTVGRGIDVNGLDHDGRRLAVVGAVEPESGNGASELRVVKLGATRVETLYGVEYGESIHYLRTPQIGPGGVDVVNQYTNDTTQNEVDSQLVRVPFAVNKPLQRRKVGALFTLFAEGGGAAAYVMATGPGGCATSLDRQFEEFFASAGCRVVRAGADPFGPLERTTPPVLTINSGSTVAADGSVTVRGRLQQTTVRAGVVGPATGVAGARVLIQVATAADTDEDGELEFPEGGRETVTGADGRWTLTLPPDTRERTVRAVTVEKPRSWTRGVADIDARPGH